MTDHRVSQLETAAIIELVDRKKMALRIFKAMKHQDPIFEQPRPKYLLVDGGNRGGKTISLTGLTTAVILDEEVCLSDGTRVPARMPWQRGRPLVIWLVCIDQRHIGNVLYPAFFKSGMFKVAYEPATKALRAYDPDRDPKKGIKPRPAPPFIPNRFIESISWESKADKIFNRVTVRDPATKEILAEIHAFTSKGDPPQGSAVDFIFVDEQLARPKYIDELKARLVDKDGQIVWSSWNDEDSEDLASYKLMIEREVEQKSGVAKQVTLTMSGNKHLSRKSVADFLAGCSTEEERLQRDLGIAPGERLRMYPLFDKRLHSAYIDGPEEDELSRVLRDRDGIPPDDWTKTLILDPGTQHPAVLLCAVPPPQFGDYVVAFQQIYPGRADPKQLARITKRQTQGMSFYRFLSDKRAGRQQTMGLAEGTRVVDAYAEAFKNERLQCATTKSQFLFASDDVGGRQLVLQGWMHPGKSPFPKLRIVTHRCKDLCEQLRKLKKRTVAKEIIDERKMAGQPSDLTDCYDEQTEVLTAKRGWVKFKDLMSSDKLATMNMKYEKLEFQKPTGLVQRHVTGDMIEIKTRRLDLLVTPRHRMVVRRASGNLAIVEAKDLTDSNCIPLTTKNGFTQGKRPRIVIPKQFRGHKQIDEITDVPAFAEFVGLWLAEGCCIKYRKVGRGYQTVISQKKPHGRAEVERILGKIPFHHTKDGVNYLISSKQLWHYMKPLGNVYTKHVPQWIKDADHETIAAFMRGYMLGDGWLDKSGSYRGSASASKQLSDDIQEIAIRLGMTCKAWVREAQPCLIRGFDNTGREKPLHNLSMSHKSKYASIINRASGSTERRYKTVQYDGMVYCATVPNGTLVVRRNGKVAVSGNCLEYFAASNPRFVLHKKVEEEGNAAFRWYMSKFGKAKPNKSVQMGTRY